MRKALDWTRDYHGQIRAVVILGLGYGVMMSVMIALITSGPMP